MKYRDNIQDIATLQPEYMGFIFYEKSSRFFNSNLPEISSDIKKVGVFVDSKIEYVTSMIKNHQLNAIQLHGNESPKYCDQLKDQSVQIIKTFSIKNEFDFKLLEPYEEVCDYFLFDTKGKLPGGNGYTFNWDLLNDYPSSKPFFLSGGIGLNEIQKLNQFQNSKASTFCFAIDVNSKFEIKAGLKNKSELEKFKHDLQH